MDETVQVTKQDQAGAFQCSEGCAAWSSSVDVILIPFTQQRSFSINVPKFRFLFSFVEAKSLATSTSRIPSVRVL